MQPPVAQPSGWVCNQDPVALRLQVAAAARRAAYECEVACRAAAPPAAPTCDVPYALAGERECARATDGCTYAVLAEPPASPRCGPCRTPPPPRCVELAPDDACRIRGDVHLDPCAHRPRVMIQIDRSAPAACAPAPCPAPPPAPPRCRRPSIVERLRAHIPGCQSERRTHTSVALCKAKKPSESVSGGLEGMLRSKEQLKEAGVGRMVTDVEACQVNKDKPTGGQLELSVPPGTERVAVHVSLSRASGGTCPPPPTPLAYPLSSSPTCSISRAPCESTPGKRNPCLPIMQIKKKWASQCDQKSARAQTVGAGCVWRSPPARGPTTTASGHTAARSAPNAARSAPTADRSASNAARSAPTEARSAPNAARSAPTAAQNGPTAARCSPFVPPRCELDVATSKSSKEPKTKIKQYSSTSAFMVNTIIANS